MEAMAPPEVAEVATVAAPEAPAVVDGRMSLAAVLRTLAELLALVRMSLCSLNPSLLCCDDVDSLEIGCESLFF